jgi:hypothetical protein
VIGEGGAKDALLYHGLLSYIIRHFIRVPPSRNSRICVLGEERFSIHPDFAVAWAGRALRAPAGQAACGTRDPAEHHWMSG